MTSDREGGGGRGEAGGVEGEAGRDVGGEVWLVVALEKGGVRVVALDECEELSVAGEDALTNDGVGLCADRGRGHGADSGGVQEGRAAAAGGRAVHATCLLLSCSERTADSAERQRVAATEG